MHTTAQGSSDENPQSAGQVAKLCGKHGPDQGARTSDRSEVVAKHHPFRCRHEVFAIRARYRSGCAHVIDGENFGNQP